MNQPEQQQIDHWFTISDKWIPHWKSEITSGEADQATYTALALDYASFARAKFLNGVPIDEVRTEFANAARCVLKSFTMAYDKQDPNYQGGKADLSCNSEGEFIEGATYALMATDFELSAKLARIFRDRPDGVQMGIEVNRYAHALKHVLLGNRQRAGGLLKAQREAYAIRPAQRNDYRKNYYTFSTALRGILNQDEELFNEGLQMQLEFYQGDAQGELKDTTQEFICDYAVALANLGLRHGLAVTVEHDTLPKGLMIRT